MRYLRYIWLSMIELAMYVLPFIFWWTAFIFRKKLRTNKNRNWFQQFLWWFLNDTIKEGPEDIDWGDYGRFKHNLWGAMQQNLFRNSHWNFRLTVFTPNSGAIKDLHPKNGRLTFYRLPINSEEPVFGKQNVTFEIDGQKLFRYSFLKEIKWLWLSGFHSTYFCVQLGATTNRYLYKCRFRKIE